MKDDIENNPADEVEDLEEDRERDDERDNKEPVKKGGKKDRADEGADDGDHEGEEEEDDGRPKKKRSGKRDRGTERMFKLMTTGFRELREQNAELRRELDEVKTGTTDAVRKVTDPKPRLLDFVGKEDEYEEALDKWHERNPKGAPKKKEGEEGDDKKKGKKGPEGQEGPQVLTTEEIADRIGVDLDTLEDHNERVEDARDEHEDYDEVLVKAKDLPRSLLMTRALIESDNGAEVNYWLLKNDRKEFKRIALMTKSREVIKALEAVEARMEESPEDDDEAEGPKKKNKRDVREPFTPIGGSKAPRGKSKDESTLSDEEFFERREEELRKGR